MDPLAASVLCALLETVHMHRDRVGADRRQGLDGAREFGWCAAPDHRGDEHGEPRAHDASEGAPHGLFDRDMLSFQIW